MAETRRFRSLICGRTNRTKELIIILDGQNKGAKHEWKNAETAFDVILVSPSWRRTHGTFYMLSSEWEI